MQPDDIILTPIEKLTGIGQAIFESGETHKLDYDVVVSARMGWAGENEPRVVLGTMIEGTIRKRGDQFFTVRHQGHAFKLIFADGRVMHAKMFGPHGRISNVDRRGIYRE